MNYEEIFSQFYLKITDPSLFKQSKEDAYDKMKGWLHSIAAEPHVRQAFSVLTLNDDIEELTFTLTKSIDEYSDKDFVKEIFAQGMVICWMEQQIDKNINLAAVVGGKEEKVMLNNYKPNIARVNSLKTKLKKFISNYGYFNNDYTGKS